MFVFLLQMSGQVPSDSEWVVVPYLIVSGIAILVGLYALYKTRKSRSDDDPGMF